MRYMFIINDIYIIFIVINCLINKLTCPFKGHVSSWLIFIINIREKSAFGKHIPWRGNVNKFAEIFPKI